MSAFRFPDWLTSCGLVLTLALFLSACTVPSPGGGFPPGGGTVQAPSNVLATAGDGAITVRWDAPPPATGFTIYLASEPGVTVERFHAMADGRRVEGVASPHTVTGLRNGTAYYLVVTAMAGSQESAASAEVSATPVQAGGKFEPAEDTVLPPGEHAFEAVDIPAGVTVTLQGDTLIRVAGDAVVAGTVRGDCTRLELRVAGAMTLDGLLANPCSAAGEADLKLVVDGALLIGTIPSDQPAVDAGGFLTIVDSLTENDPLEPAVEFDSLEAFMGSVEPAAPTLEPLAGGAGAGIDRPIRARRGINVRRFDDLDLTKGAEVAQPGDDGADVGPVNNCDIGNTIGGIGGSVYLGSRNGTLTINGNLTAGNGGRGGNCRDTAKNLQAPASATAGHGGRGGGIYVGGVTIRFVGNPVLRRGDGGNGGEAVAHGADGANPCAPGQPATAAGGNGGRGGGIGYLYFAPGGIVGAPSEDGGNGGTGGFATAVGGNANPDCNAGAGGPGGAATATAGQGGDGATRNIWPVVGGFRSGNGGNAFAKAGDGGAGQDMCMPILGLGSMGGAGGTAAATGGPAGARGMNGRGQDGLATALGGFGGQGGDGVPPGRGGVKGTATAIGRGPVQTDGREGAPGAWCPLGFFGFIGDLPQGMIEPGSYAVRVVEADRETVTEDRIEVVVRSDGADYLREGDRFLIGAGGGLEFGFTGVFGLVDAFRVTVDPQCGGSGPVQLRGLVDNEVVAVDAIYPEEGETMVQITYAPGFDDVYLEAMGGGACLGPWALELGIERIGEDVRLADLGAFPQGLLEPGSQVRLPLLAQDRTTVTGGAISALLQDTLDAHYASEAGNLYIASGGLEFDLRAAGGTVTGFTALLSGACGEGGTVTMTGLVDNEPVAVETLQLDHTDEAIAVAFPEGIEEVYLETPDGAFCLRPWSLRLDVAAS